MFFEHKKTYRLFKAEVPDGDTVVPIGKASVARAGKHLSIFCYGFMRTCALEAAETLAREDGVEAEVVDLRTLRPLDTETILASVAQDRQGARRPRGEPIRWLRRRDRRRDQRASLRAARRPGDAPGRSRRPGRAVPPRPGGLVHDRPGTDRRCGAQARGLLTRSVDNLLQRRRPEETQNRWQPRSRCPSWANRSPKARSSAGWSRKATPSSSTTRCSRSSPTR